MFRSLSSERLRKLIAAPTAIALLLSVLVVTLASGASSNTYTACLSSSGNLYNVTVGSTPLSPCRKGDTTIQWNQRAGPTGARRVIFPIMGLKELYDYGDFNECGPGWATLGENGGGTFGPCTGSNNYASIFTAFNFDASQYPSNAQFFFRVKLVHKADAAYCVRLYDLATSSSINNSEICAGGAGTPDESLFLGRGGLVLPSGPNGDVMVVQENQVDGYADPGGGLPFFVPSGNLLQAYLDISW